MFNLENLREKFNIQFVANVRAFKAVRPCCPVQVSALRPDARSLEELKNFPFVNDAMIAALATELPLYLATADGVVCDNEEEKLTWFVNCLIRGLTSHTTEHYRKIVKRYHHRI